MSPFAAPDHSRVVAVLDTNVVLDIASCHDAYDAAKDDRPEAEQDYRRQRAAAAIRLAVYLHETRSTTYSLREPVVVAQQLVPPWTAGTKSNFIRCFFHFVKDSLLSNWRMTVPEPASNARGNRADEELLELASQLGRPVVSNEGLTPTGVDLKNRMRRKAEEAGVQVVTPDEFVAGKLEPARVATFLARFRTLAPAYHEGRPDYVDAQLFLKDMQEYYADLLTCDAGRPVDLSACRERS